MFAALNIYKPLNLTSHDVVARVRRIYGLKKVGHLGTLDPLAEGVLPVCLGQATRLIEYFPSDKRYTAEITLGRTTTTLDREGEVLSELDCSQLSLPPLEAVLNQFRGTITQQVPIYSAVQVNGQRLYQLARAGKEAAELPSRQVTIASLNLLQVDTENPQHPVLHLDITCSSGTYIRSLARDIGGALGCGAYLSQLIRTRHGHFTVDTSKTLEELAGNPSAGLLNPGDYLELPRLQLEPSEIQKLQHGIAVSHAQPLNPEQSYLIVQEHQIRGVVQYQDAHLRPVKILNMNP